MTMLYASTSKLNSMRLLQERSNFVVAITFFSLQYMLQYPDTSNDT